MGMTHNRFSKQAPLHSSPRGVALLLTCLAVCVAVPGCISGLVMKKAGAALSGGGTVFSGDDDPELVADALPFALKTYESLLQAMPDNFDLLLSTGSAFTMYAYAFVQLPAGMIPDTRTTERAEQMARAKKLFLRARGYLLRAMELRYPGARAQLEQGNAGALTAQTGQLDTALLYWTGASWMGAFTCDVFDMSVSLGVPAAVALVRRSLELDETYGQGSAHEFFISYYGSMPASMGGSEAKAREHFARAVKIAGGAKAGPYVALATSVCVGTQDAAEFSRLLDSALAIDVDANPGSRLANILTQRKARWLKANIDNYFLPAAEEGDNGEELSP